MAFIFFQWIYNLFNTTATDDINQTYPLLQLKLPILNEDIISYITKFIPTTNPFTNTSLTMYDLEDFYTR